MTRRHLILAGIFLLTVILAFALRDIVEAMVILPIAYLWWQLKLFYAALPQVVFLVLLILVVLYSAIVSLASGMHQRVRQIQEVKPAQGNIEILADCLRKSQHGMYYRWMIANRLGKNTREILAQRDGYGASKKFGPLNGRGWNPPQEIDAYLNTGLNGSFADFPRKHWFWQSPRPTPLDLDPQQAINFLEDEMETSHDRDRKSI